jgi:hypothetical protein
MSAVANMCSLTDQQGEYEDLLESEIHRGKHLRNHLAKETDEVIVDRPLAYTTSHSIFSLMYTVPNSTINQYC